MTKKIWMNISACGWIAVGACFMALAVRLVYEPMSMVTGGFSGIGILVKHYIDVPVSVATFALNVPLFVWGYHVLGGRFIVKSLWGMICFSFFLAAIPIRNLVGSDMLFASVVGGAIGGVGLGIVMSRGGATGGSDLLGSILCHYKKTVTLSAMIAIVDGSIVFLGMIVYGVQSGLYSIVAVYITSKVLDRILEGFNFSKVLYVISEQADLTTEMMMEKMHRGVTQMKGTGGFTKEEKGVLICVLGKKELTSALQIVKSVDPRAFVIIMDAREVRGKGFCEL